MFIQLFFLGSVWIEDWGRSYFAVERTYATEGGGRVSDVNVWVGRLHVVWSARRVACATCSLQHALPGKAQRLHCLRSVI